jgi:CBS domain containing-hemolysin-like protein
VGEHETHSVDELRLLVDQSKEGGIIQAENYEIIKNAFDFTDHSARQIMVPRHEIFALRYRTYPLKNWLKKYWKTVIPEFRYMKILWIT